MVVASFKLAHDTVLECGPVLDCKYDQNDLKVTNYIKKKIFLDVYCLRAFSIKVSAVRMVTYVESRY